MIDSVGSFASALDSVRGASNVDRVSVARRAPTQSAEASFAETMASVASQAVDTLKTAEGTSLQSIRAKASVQQVVESVMAAEQALHTAIAVRDKMVSAYQELTRMQI